MAEAHAKPNHDYHLVSPSPWPLVGSIFVFLAAVGLIMTMKGLTLLGLKMGGMILGIGVAGILYVMAAWWYDVIRESEVGDHTPIVQIGLRYGMILFISSEVMFFVAWFWAFFDASLFSGEAIQATRVAFTGGTWPPKGVEVLDPLNLPLLNTLILLTSGTTVTWAHHALIRGDQGGLRTGLLLTIVLGAIFTSVQAWEYAHAPFGFSNSIYGATFFMATGFHGAHVIIGTIFLIVCFVMAQSGLYKAGEQHLSFEFAAWYWHFVDVVWLFLFSCIYVWGSWGAHIEGVGR